MSIESDTKDIMKSRRRTLLLLVFMVILVFLVFSPSGYLSRFSYSSDIGELEDNIELEKKTSDSLKGKIQALENDLYEIEMVARTKYGMIKPGEKIFFLDSVGKDN
ncbi:MAG: hypothetical protein Kapaf2KO_05420 [Candidatus Kapaibacteriales bacterium]